VTEPVPPDDVKTEFAQRLQQYKALYVEWFRVQDRPCDCDRSSCGRCMELNNISRELHNLRSEGMS